MKAQRLLLPLITLGLAGAYGVQQENQESELKAKLEALELRVGTVETYLQAQAKQGEAFQSALDTSVEKGFTFGINPESREILVEAWRQQAKAASTGVPGAAEKTKKADPRVVRRR